MKIKKIDISTFQRSHSFYGRIDALTTIKSFDLQAIRKRYITSKSNKGNKTGSVERRIPSLGGIANIAIENGQLIKSDVLIRTKEPRALHVAHNKFGFAAENKVYVINEEGSTTTLQNPWFSYIHTIQFHPKNHNRLLISSSGFDLILEYDYTSKTQTHEWLAWEHGFNATTDPKTGDKLLLTRDKNYAAEETEKGKSVLLISDPSTDYLPTAKRAAFINSVVYDSTDPTYMIATFFHEGAVFRINIEEGEAVQILDGLKNPHGGHMFNGNVLATSTGSGEIHLKNSMQERSIYSFQNLKGKPEELSGMEWIQNTISEPNFFVSIDSNRTSFVVFSAELQLYDIIPFDENWAVQDIVIGSLNSAQINALSTIS